MTIGQFRERVHGLAFPNAHEAERAIGALPIVFNDKGLPEFPMPVPLMGRWVIMLESDGPLLRR